MSRGPRPISGGMSRAEARQLIARELAAAGIDGAEGDADHLVAGILGLAWIDLVARGEEPVGALADRLVAALTRRLAREPVWRILGQRAFYGLELQIGPAVLDPRPDTETLVDVVLEATADAGAAAPLRILDLGTGSGAILLALLHERPSARGVGVDRSAAALQIARRNGEQLGLNDRVAWIESDWFAGVSGRFDVIVSNPPYIPTGEIAGLDPEVRNHDPRAALDGGGDGLDAYRAIVAGVAQHLAPGGLVAFEIGDIQGPAVSALMFSAGLELVGGVRRDLSERPRVVVARAPVGKSP